MFVQCNWGVTYTGEFNDCINDTRQLQYISHKRDLHMVVPASYLFIASSYKFISFIIYMLCIHRIIFGPRKKRGGEVLSREGLQWVGLTVHKGYVLKYISGYCNKKNPRERKQNRKSH